jgi:hypothetical protein
MYVQVDAEDEAWISEYDGDIKDEPKCEVDPFSDTDPFASSYGSF